MNAEKLKRLQSQVRIGGKGTPRRKKKVTHQTAATDDKKLQSSLKKLSVSTIPGIEEVNIIKDDLTVIHFNNPKAQASLSANTFAVTGHGETKKVVEMLPEILPQLGQETVVQLRMFANSMSSGSNQKPKQSAEVINDFVDDVPLLVEDFDQIATQEASAESISKPNTKGKNTPKASTEDQQKYENPDHIARISEEEKLKIEDGSQLSAEPKNDKLNKMKTQIIDQKQIENPAMKQKEKQDKQNKKPSNEKSQGTKETRKQDLKETSIQTSSSNKCQSKNNKKQTPSSTGNKNLPKEELKKESQPTVTGELNDTLPKDFEQSNKKDFQNKANKSDISGNQEKGKENQKKGQTIQKSLVSDPEPTGAFVEIIQDNVSKVETSINTTKNDLHLKSLNSGEKSSSQEIKPVVKEVLQPEQASGNCSERTKDITENQSKAIVKDLALPIPPIIPLHLKMSDGGQLPIEPTTIELTSKKDVDLFEHKNEPLVTKSLPETNMDGDCKDNKIVGSQENRSFVNTAQNLAVVDNTPSQRPASSEKIIEVPEKLPSSVPVDSAQVENLKGSNLPKNTAPNVTIDKPQKTSPTSEEKLTLPFQESCNKPENVEVLNQKMLPDESPSQQENVTKYKNPEVKIKEQCVTPTQQKIQGTSKQPINQKQGVSKEANKRSVPQKQKLSSESKGASLNTDSKRGTDMSNEKPSSAKPSQSNNNTTKSQSPQQQPVRQQVAAQVSTKPTEKPAISPKISTGSTRSAPGGKKTPASNNTKPGTSSVDNKNKTNTPVNKPKTNVAPAPQKPGKPRSNVNANAPQLKVAEKQPTSQTTDIKVSQTPPTTEKQ